MTVLEDTKVVKGGENSTCDRIKKIQLTRYGGGNKMKNQRGVTLIELLVIIVIMGAIFIPISMMLIYSLETEKEVSIKNDVQREARLIMEYVTEKMRNKNVVWNKEETQWKLLIA